MFSDVSWNLVIGWVKLNFDYFDSLYLSSGDSGFTVTKFDLSLLIFNFTIFSPASNRFYAVLNDFLNFNRIGDVLFKAHCWVLASETAEDRKSGVSLVKDF